jgi:hypothetical protein
MFDAEFAHRKPSAVVRYADFVVSELGAEDTVDGMTKIKRFKDEEFPKILVSVNMLDTGFDCPEVVNLVMARFTKSGILYQQMRGRGTRRADHIKKTNFSMFDFVGVTDFHGDEEDEYLFHFIRQQEFRRLAKANFTGTAGQQRVPTEFLQRTPIPLPPLPIDLSDMKYVEVDGHELRKLQLRDGDLLFVRTNGNPDYVGRCAAFETRIAERSGLASDEFVYASYLIRARLRNDRVRPVFLQTYMTLPAARKALVERHPQVECGAVPFGADGQRHGVVSIA